MSAPVIVVAVLCGIAIAALTVVRSKSPDNFSPRAKAIRSLAMWTMVLLVALAIWLIAQRQIPH
jgi:hypothetical protein